MLEFEELIENEFFIIDSENLNEVKERLYGFMVTKDGIIQNNNFNKDIEIAHEGLYILIEKHDNIISIKQDFNGSYGLYVYETEDYFAISNSFLKLVNYLKYNHELSFNKTYADCYLFMNLISTSYLDTLVNEIKSIPRHYRVHIDMNSKKIDYESIDYGENSVPLDSKLAFEILDRWYDKWISIIRLIKSKTNRLSFDLSGGFDSRTTAVLWLTANIDFDKMNIKSLHDTKGTYEPDFRIASQIAEYFNFNLNKPVPKSKPDYNYSKIDIPLEISFNLKLGYHKHMFFQPFKFGETEYSFSGGGGECLRGYVLGTRENFIHRKKHIINHYGPSLLDNAEIEMNKTLDQIIENFGFPSNPAHLAQLHYNETRARYHFGKTSLESYFANKLAFVPLIDSDLRKLQINTSECEDSKLLIITILSRYCPDLLKFEFESRKVDEATIEYAKKLNEKYPFQKKDLPFISGPEIPEKPIEKAQKEDNIVQIEDINNYLKEIFLSNAFEKEFEKYYSFDEYNTILKLIETNPRRAFRNFGSSIAIITIAKAVEFSKIQSIKNEKDILDTFLEDEHENSFERISKSLTEIYHTSRIDIKNVGNNNSIEILDLSDDNAKIQFPKNMNDEKGKGCVVSSKKGNIQFKIKCVNDGELNIKLRGKYVKDKNNNIFPVYIDITKFKLNNKYVLNENKLVSHPQSYTYKKPVKDGEIVEIYIEWLPFNESSVYELDHNKLNYNKLNYNKLNYKKLNYKKLNYNKLNYNKLNYNKLNYKKLNYNKLDYDKINYNKMDYNKFNYNKLDYNEINYNKLDLDKISFINMIKIKFNHFFKKK